MEFIIFRFDMLFDAIPVDRSSTNVGRGGILSGANAGAVNDLLGVDSKEFVGESVSDMIGKANHVTELFGGGAGERSVLALVIDLVPEWESEKDADVDGVASEELKGDGPTKGFIRSEIHDE
jgi:hypothetical protein